MKKITREREREGKREGLKRWEKQKNERKRLIIDG
jgi:hypothetical protein